MATYPIKMLKDENGTPFVPLISLDSVQDADGKNINDLLENKIEATDIKAGNQIEIEVDGNTITINNSAEGMKLINNTDTTVAGTGALDAAQGKVLKDSIPEVVNNLTTIDSKKALSAHQGYVLAGRVAPVGGATGQVLKKASDSDYSFEWGDAADPNAIVGDGSIMKIIELTYNEYLELEKNNALAEDTEYHISDWNENERTYLTTQDIEEIVYDKTANHTTENQVSSMIESSIINNLTSISATKSLSAAQGKVLNDKIKEKRKVMRLTRSEEIQWYGTTTPARMPYDIINYNSSGGALTKSREGSIRIGAGVQQVRVSGQIPIDIPSPDSLLYIFVYLYLNDTCVFKTLRPNIRWDVLGIYDIVLDVKEGDVIDLYISTNNSKQILLCAGNDYDGFGPGAVGYLQVEILA